MNGYNNIIQPGNAPGTAVTAATTAASVPAAMTVPTVPAVTEAASVPAVPTATLATTAASAAAVPSVHAAAPVPAITAAHISGFARALTAEEKSRNTVTQYCRTVTSLRTWLDGREVTQTLLGEWKSSLIQRLRPSSVNAALAALNSFLKYMRAAEGWDLCKMTFVKVQRRLFCDESREISKEEYRRLVTVAAARGHARLGMLLETMCSLGIRVSEIGHITAEAVRAGKAYIHMKGKTRTILIPDILANKLMKYMKKRGIKTGRIFITRTGRGISRSQVWKELNRLSKEAGVDPRKVFPHNFRHLFARTHYEKYGDIVKLADILGHSSIETTRRYLITSGKEHARQLEELGLVLAE